MNVAQTMFRGPQADGFQVLDAVILEGARWGHGKYICFQRQRFNTNLDVAQVRPSNTEPSTSLLIIPEPVEQTSCCLLYFSKHRQSRFRGAWLFFFKWSASILCAHLDHLSHNSRHQHLYLREEHTSTWFEQWGTNYFVFSRAQGFSSARQKFPQSQSLGASYCQGTTTPTWCQSGFLVFLKATRQTTAVLQPCCCLHLLPGFGRRCARSGTDSSRSGPPALLPRSARQGSPFLRRMITDAHIVSGSLVSLKMCQNGNNFVVPSKTNIESHDLEKFYFANLLVCKCQSRSSVEREKEKERNISTDW